MPLAVNLFLLPAFAWSIFRSAVAIVNDENRERLAANWSKPTVSQQASTPFAVLLAIVATFLAAVGLGMVAVGMPVAMDALRVRDGSRAMREAEREGIAHLQSQAVLTPLEQQRLRQMENSVRAAESIYDANQTKRVMTWGSSRLQVRACYFVP